MRLMSAFLVVLLSATAAFGYEAKVVAVTDGDTIKVLRNGEEIKIRLFGIDCPEKKQAFGQAARKQTAFYVANHIVEIDVVDQDRYGRTIGLVTFDGGKNLSEELVKSGYAWVYRQYCKRRPLCSDWVLLENDAMRNQRGLWVDHNPEPPWEWRKKKN